MKTKTSTFFNWLFAITGKFASFILVEITTCFEAFLELSSCSMKPDFNSIKRYLENLGYFLVGESLKFIENDDGAVIWW